MVKVNYRSSGVSLITKFMCKHPWVGRSDVWPLDFFDEGKAQKTTASKRRAPKISSGHTVSVSETESDGGGLIRDGLPPSIRWIRLGHPTLKITLCEQASLKI